MAQYNEIRPAGVVPFSLTTSRGGSSHPEIFLSEMRATLERKRYELQASFARRSDLEIEHAPEAMEEAMLSASRDRAAMDSERDRQALKSVVVALERMDAGDWGVCIACDEPISERRLRAVPAATRCVKCQTAFDAEQED